MTESARVRLCAELEELPEEPGVYCFLDSSGKALYVGKARSLRKRVRSYFQREIEPRLAAMLQAAWDIEYVTAASEEEALLIENQWIKSRQPRYNVMLRDDKTYPYLKLTKEPWPRLALTRRVLEDGADYFGPYVPGGTARRAMRLVQRVTGVRVCDLAIDGSLSRPCLYHSLGRCLAPCVAGLTTPEAYELAVARARALLSGRTRAVAEELRKEMEQAAEALHFERAAGLRDLLFELEQLAQGDRKASNRALDADIFGLAVHGGQVAVSVLWIRGGLLVDRRELFWESPHAVDPGTVLAELLPQYYAGSLQVPAEIYLPFRVEGEEGFVGWLSERRPGGVRILHPAKGRAAERLLEAQRDAERAFARRFRQGTLSSMAVERLGAWLELSEPIRWMEGLDIAHSQGREPIGAAVVWREGRFWTRAYRAYRLQGVPPADDFAALHQLVLRRYGNLAEEGAGMPDLVLVDGGRGQLRAVLEAFQVLGEEVPTVALAKGEELLFLPSRPEPLRLERSDAGLLLLERVRDEAHRWANSRHRRARSRRSLASSLTAIPGIGPKRKRQLLRVFGSLEGVRQASLEELSRVLGGALGRRVKEAFQGDCYDNTASG